MIHILISTTGPYKTLLQNSQEPEGTAWLQCELVSLPAPKKQLHGRAAHALRRVLVSRDRDRGSLFLVQSRAAILAPSYCFLPSCWMPERPTEIVMLVASVDHWTTCSDLGLKAFSLYCYSQGN